jgi:hypothetical protein
MRIRTRPSVICATIAVPFFCAVAIVARPATTFAKTNDGRARVSISRPAPTPRPRPTQPPRPEPAIRVTVTNASDNVDGDTSSVQTLLGNPGSDGTISLREALLAANNTGGTNPITITFALTLTGQSIFPVNQMFIQRDGITLQGFLDNTHQPAVTIDASQLVDPFVLFETAAKVAVRSLRFANIQSSAGFVFINVNVQASRPQIGRITVDGNVFTNQPGLTTHGIGVYVNMDTGTTGAVVSNIIVTNNTFTHFEGDNDGILIQPNGTNNTIQDTLIAGNTFLDTTFGVELVPANASSSRIIRSRIIGNSFATNIQPVNLNQIGTDGLPPATGNIIDDTLITGNRFTNNRGPEVVLLGGMTNATANTISNTHITNNIMTGSTQYGGIAIVGGREGGTSNTIQGVAAVNNTIVNEVGGGMAAVSNINTSGNTVSGVSASNMILWGNINGLDFGGEMDPSQVQYSITAQSGYFGINHNINADPLFVNPAGNDFHLQSGSPALHAGTSIGAPRTDLDCQPRGFPPSMGAYEFDGPNICNMPPSPRPTPWPRPTP